MIVPTGALAFLPVHAGWVDDPMAPTGRWYLIDEAVVSYAPTALALAAARRRPSAAVSASSLLGISDPRPSVERPLTRAAAEVARAGALFDAAEHHTGPAALLADVMRLLPSHDTVHLGCHAVGVLEDPRRSGIVLAYDQMVTVGDLVGIDLTHAKLAVLSACETAVPGLEAPDELVAISTALFQAGFDGVVASLWPVLDSSALVLMARFYELWRGSGGPRHDPAAALVAAQRWVRDTTNAEKLGHWDELARGGMLPDETHEALQAELGQLDPGARDFASPDDWAPFTFVGAW